MEFIAKFVLYGILFAGPVDRPLFPVQVETDYTLENPRDAAERWELVGTDRIIIRTGRMVNGAFVEDTGETSGTNLMLDEEGFIRSKCSGFDCDYRQNGWDYLREGGRYARLRAWSGGAVQKTWEITYQDGRLISASEGMLQVSWFGKDITRTSQMMREEPPPLYHVRTYTYDSSLTDPASDTVLVESRNPYFEPQEALQIHRLRGGRLTSRIEFDMATGGQYSETLYRYQAPVFLPIIAPRRVSSRVDAVPAVDALGRLLPGSRGAVVRAWPAVAFGLGPARVAGPEVAGSR